MIDPRLVPPPHSHSQWEGLRLSAHPGYERDQLHLQAVAVGPGVAATVRFDRDARAWLRRWLDHMDEQATPEDRRRSDGQAAGGDPPAV
jgi:hypothetical protein